MEFLAENLGKPYILLAIIVLLFPGLIVSFIVDIVLNCIASGNKTNKSLLEKTKKRRIDSFKIALRGFLRFAAISFLILYKLPPNYTSIYEPINCLYELIKSNYEAIKQCIELVNIIFSALIGALIGFILSSDIDCVDNCFDEDIINQYIIKPLNTHIIAERKPYSFEFSEVSKDNDAYISTASWETNKYILRCDSKNGVFIHDEGTTEENKNVKLAKITNDKAIKIKMTFGLHFKSLEEKGVKFIQTQMQLSGTISEDEQLGERDCTIINCRNGGSNITVNSNDSNGDSINCKVKEIKKEQIEECINSSISYCFKQVEQIHKASKLVPLNNKPNRIDFYSIAFNLPLKAEQEYVKQYVADLSVHLNKIFELIFKTFTDCNFQNIDKFIKEHLVTEKQMNYILEIENGIIEIEKGIEKDNEAQNKKEKPRKFCSLSYFNGDANCFINKYKDALSPIVISETTFKMFFIDIEKEEKYKYYKFAFDKENQDLSKWLENYDGCNILISKQYVKKNEDGNYCIVIPLSRSFEVHESSFPYNLSNKQIDNNFVLLQELRNFLQKVDNEHSKDN